MWGVPVDHDMFKAINSAQWLWYYNNYIEDRKEKYEQSRDMVEYNASFVEPEAVRKIREAREKAIEIPDKEFFAGIKHLFGRDLKSTGSINQNKELTKVDVAKAIKEYQDIQKQTKFSRGSGLNYREWVNIELG